MSDSDGSATPPPVVVQAKSKHVPPPWSGPPKFDISLEVLKGGSVLNTLPVADREYYVIGRQPDVCDILLEHPTVSRQHAVLQYGEQGEPYLLDLGSVHGTFLNRNRLKAMTYTPLTVGSVIKFGESTRFYHVLGPSSLRPPEETSEALERSRMESEARQERKAAEKVLAAKRAAQRDTGCAWGFDEDAQASDDDGADLDDDAPEARYRMTKRATHEFVPDSDKGLNDKDRQVFDRIQGHKLKVNNLEVEIARIRAKEGDDGLTESQQTHIMRATERIAQLQQTIADLSDTLHQRNRARNATRARKAKRNMDNSDDDDFYDRTEMTAAKRRKKQANREAAAKTSATVETVETLTAKVDAARLQLEDHITRSATELAMAASSKAPVVASAGGDEDELEAFMQATTQAASGELEGALKAREGELRAEVERLEAMLRLAQPALPDLKPKSEAVAPVAAAAPKKKKSRGKKKAGGGGADGDTTAAKPASTPTLTAEEEQAELDAALGGKGFAAPRMGLGAGPPAPAAAAPVAAPPPKPKPGFTLKPGLNIRRKAK